MLAHDAVAAAVLHKHHPIIRVGAGLIQFVYHPIIRVGAGLIQFVYKSHSRLATEFARVCCFVLLNRYWGIVMYGPELRRERAKGDAPTIRDRRRPNLTLSPHI